MTVDNEECRNLDRALSLEWLETNGRGGFSSGTVAGANTRRYHALLLTARKPPCERFMLVNHLDEWLVVDGQAIPLSTNLYPNAITRKGTNSALASRQTPGRPGPITAMARSCNEKSSRARPRPGRDSMDARRENQGGGHTARATDGERARVSRNPSYI